MMRWFTNEEGGGYEEWGADRRTPRGQAVSSIQTKSDPPLLFADAMSSCWPSLAKEADHQPGAVVGAVLSAPVYQY